MARRSPSRKVSYFMRRHLGKLRIAPPQPRQQPVHAAMRLGGLAGVRADHSLRRVKDGQVGRSSLISGFTDRRPRVESRP
jgi:hypothetical protein